jgi:hypothetical protein
LSPIKAGSRTAADAEAAVKSDVERTRRVQRDGERFIDRWPNQ